VGVDNPNAKLTARILPVVALFLQRERVIDDTEVRLCGTVGMPNNAPDPRRVDSLAGALKEA
jgi:hypothetical protein